MGQFLAGGIMANRHRSTGGLQMNPDLSQAFTLAVTQIFLGGIYVMLLVEFRQPVRTWRLRWLVLAGGIVVANVAALRCSTI